MYWSTGSPRLSASSDKAAFHIWSFFATVPLSPAIFPPPSIDSILAKSSFPQVEAHGICLTETWYRSPIRECPAEKFPSPWFLTLWRRERRRMALQPSWPSIPMLRNCLEVSVFAAARSAVIHGANTLTWRSDPFILALVLVGRVIFTRRSVSSSLGQPSSALLLLELFTSLDLSATVAFWQSLLVGQRMVIWSRDDNPGGSFTIQEGGYFDVSILQLNGDNCELERWTACTQPDFTIDDGDFDSPFCVSPAFRPPLKSIFLWWDSPSSWKSVSLHMSDKGCDLLTTSTPTVRSGPTISSAR